MPDDHVVRLHTRLGNMMPGVIVELRNAEHDHASDRDMTHLSDEDAHDLYRQLAEWAKPHGYDTKTIRVHEPGQGRYVLLMMTRFDGIEALLGEHGWGGTYIQYQVISRNSAECVAGTDPWKIARKFPGEWFPDSNTASLMKALDMDRIGWHEFHDGMKIGADAIVQLLGSDADV